MEASWLTNEGAYIRVRLYLSALIPEGAYIRGGLYPAGLMAGIKKTVLKRAIDLTTFFIYCLLNFKTS